MMLLSFSDPNPKKRVLLSELMARHHTQPDINSGLHLYKTPATTTPPRSKE